jgi:hypothetical protein
MAGDPIVARRTAWELGREGPALALLRGVGRALGLLPRPVAALATSGWMFLIWWLSSGPIDLRTPLPAADFFWNLAHAPVFGTLAVLAAVAAAPRPLPRAWPDPGRWARLVAFSVVAGWAAIDELHQREVVGRSGSPFDFLTDVTAAACVLWIAGYAGSTTASERGLRRRLGIGVALCVAAALVTTLSDRGA